MGGKIVRYRYVYICIDRRQRRDENGSSEDRRTEAVRGERRGWSGYVNRKGLGCVSGSTSQCGFGTRPANLPRMNIQ